MAAGVDRNADQRRHPRFATRGIIVRHPVLANWRVQGPLSLRIL